jgi:hypothetical protein
LYVFHAWAQATDVIHSNDASRLTEVRAVANPTEFGEVAQQKGVVNAVGGKGPSPGGQQRCEERTCMKALLSQCSYGDNAAKDVDYMSSRLRRCCSCLLKLFPLTHTY